MSASRSALRSIALRVPGMGALVRQLDELRQRLAVAQAALASVEASLADERAGRAAVEAALATAREQLAQEAASREAIELAARQADERARDTIGSLEARLEAGPLAFEPGSPPLAGVRFSRPVQMASVMDLGLFSERAPGHAQALLAHLDNPGPLAAFLRRYMELDDSDSEASRFALVVELVMQLAGDAWIDLGSFGHDAAYIASLRPDLQARLFSYEGGRVGIYPDGFRYVSSDGPDPLASAFIEPLDFESEPLPVDSGSVALLTAFEVFEHFKFGPRGCMLEVNRVLRTGGRLVVTVPNAASAAALWRLLHGEHPAMCSLYHRDPGLGRIHPSEYSGRQLRALADASGFEVDVLTAYSTGDYAPHECKAIGLCHAGNFRGAVEGDDDFGEGLLMVATKVREVGEPGFPETLFEKA